MHAPKPLLPLALCLLLTAGCGRTVPPSPAPEAPSEPQVPPAEEAAAVRDPHELDIVLPEKYLDLLIVTTEFEEEDTHRISLLSVREKASVEAAERDFGSGDGFGFLFGIAAMDQVGFEQLLCCDYAGCDVFARDDGWYYVKTYPTDVQFYRSDNATGTQTENWADWETLDALGDQVCADIVSRNGLTPYTQWEVRNQPFIWEGNHAFAKYYTCYYSDGSKALFDTLVLSQPMKQGMGGVWCVERVYDDFGTEYLYFPDSGVPAADYYAELQAACDAGQHPELLTPLGAAKSLLSGWYGITPPDESIELTDAVDRSYFTVNQAASHVILSLLVDPETVAGQEVLDCVGQFRNDTWGVMEERQYGADWWTPLLTALEQAAVGDGQADRDRAMMRAFLTARDPYAEAIGSLLKTQWAADPEAFDRAASEFPPEQQAQLMDAAAGK